MCVPYNIKELMKCNFCTQEKELIKSHIIPEFMYQDLYNNEHRFYKTSAQDIKDGKELKPLEQIGEFDKNLLCAECDNERIGCLEKYGQKVLLRKDLMKEEDPICENYEIDSYEFSECENVNYNKFKLFLLSILWRSHLTERPSFSSVNLGPHADKIKNMLWNNDAGEELVYPITITSFIRAEYHFNDLILEPRLLKSSCGVRFYVFSIGSFQFYFFVNSINHKLPDFVGEFTLKKNNTIRIIHLKNGKEKELIKSLVQ